MKYSVVQFIKPEMHEGYTGFSRMHEALCGQAVRERDPAPSIST